MSKEWNFKQELVAVFGKPIAENPTQYMIEKAFAHPGELYVNQYQLKQEMKFPQQPMK